MKLEGIFGNIEFDEGKLEEVSRTIVDKKWGKEYWLVNKDYCCKVLKVNPSCKGSVHRHLLKKEMFWTIGGVGILEKWSNGHIKKVGTSIELQVEQGEYHRITNLSNVLPLYVLEVSTVHSDEDVERLEEGSNAAIKLDEITLVECIDEKKSSNRKSSDSENV